MADDGDFLADIPPLPEGEFCVYGTVYAFPEHADALEAVYQESTRLAEFEPGLVYYCISRDGDDPTIFHFFERYKSKEAFTEHTSQPLMQKLFADKYIKGVKAKFAKPLLPVEAGN